MSTLNPDNEPAGPDDENASRGRDGRALGPSDSSDSGSDTAGARRHSFDVDSPLDAHALERGDATLDSDTDRAGTGERAAADGDATFEESADIEPDRLEQLAEPPDAGEADESHELDERGGERDGERGGEPG
ncbi:chemotaxis protein [Burkholderia multivorans]|jgi:hypothetical protein|uniref:hypothetical protein n=1 Tax=Burkholderia multivorans TaxID=87883 RepID=UPI0005D78419|nr:hypothetical protein [Burkholderia multivorans]AJY14987.1 putative chemotaxis protein histidine kinase [Burkholderia multivorans ATCC BAA-247]AVR20495.1 chemotaxis protein [Burkholderia multivorans]KOE22793.1 chemotaxis protein [Burkholderia multivorans R-20526]MBU9245965.1 chemotaxis protein [Burkholderia multivorans]MBU9494641.1 chemotaxis protein [Burkholderia multivorans]